MKKILSIIVTVERPEGTTFEQEVAVRNNEKPEQAMARCKKACGSGYWCCGWYPRSTLTYYLVRVKLKLPDDTFVFKYYTTWKASKQLAIDAARERHASDNVVNAQAIEIDEI